MSKSIAILAFAVVREECLALHIPTPSPLSTFPCHRLPLSLLIPAPTPLMRTLIVSAETEQGCAVARIGSDIDLKGDDGCSNEPFGQARAAILSCNHRVMQTIETLTDLCSQTPPVRRQRLDRRDMLLARIQLHVR